MKNCSVKFAYVRMISAKEENDPEFEGPTQYETLRFHKSISRCEVSTHSAVESSLEKSDTSPAQKTERAPPITSV